MASGLTHFSGGFVGRVLDKDQMVASLRLTAGGVTVLCH